MKVELGDIIVGLDIGSSKVCAVVGSMEEDGIDIIGIGIEQVRVAEQGAIINIEGAVRAVQKVIQEAEVMGNCHIREVFAGISGPHLKGFNSHGIVPIQNPEAVRQRDIGRVLNTARAVAIPPQRSFLHVIAQKYLIDGKENIRDPLGMPGVRLEVFTHMITGSRRVVEQIQKVCKQNHIDVTEFISNALASSEAVLLDDEKERGVLLIDIGSSHIELALWEKGSILMTHVLDLGGDLITSDLAEAYQLGMKEAERLKVKYGQLMSQKISPLDLIRSKMFGAEEDFDISKQEMAQLIEMRLEDIFRQIKDVVEAYQLWPKVRSGIVLTGGTSALPEIHHFAASYFQIPARIGVPRNVGGMVDIIRDPKFTAAVGLILYGVYNDDYALNEQSGHGFLHRLSQRFKRWLKEVL